MNRTRQSRGLRAARLSLGILGAGLIGYGVLGLPTQLGIAQLVGLLAWLACAVLLHDGVLVPLTTLAGFGLRRLTFGLRSVSASLVRTALLIGAVVTGLVALVVKAQSVARNTSVLEQNYAANLGWFWLVLAVATAVSVYLVERAAVRRVRRQKTRP